MDDQKLFFTKLFTLRQNNSETTEKRIELKEDNMKEIRINEWQQEYEVIYKSYVIE